MDVYEACIFSTHLYGNESCTFYARQEATLNAFHFHCLRKILGISRQDPIFNKNILKKARTESVFSLLKEKRLLWFGHVRRMKDGRLSKDIFYRELADGSRAIDIRLLRFKVVCKRDLKTCDIDIANWEVLCTDRSNWRKTVKEGALKSEILREERWTKRHEKQKKKDQKIEKITNSQSELLSF